MSESDPRTDEEVPQAEPASFGARLAAAREAAGISVGDMASRLRLHINQVRALESENLAQLPEAAYVRGFVRSYARALNLDPAPLIEDFNRKAVPPADSVVEGMTRTRDYSPVRAAAREQASRWLVLGLAVAALIALGLIGWFATRQSAASSGAAAPAVAVAAPTAPPAAMVLPVSGSAGSAAAGDAAGAPPDAAAADDAAPDAAADAAPMEPAPAPSQPLDEAEPIVALTFSGPAWVEVTDAAGKVLVSQTARAGEVLRPVGSAPFAVVIGDASKVMVTVRGQPLDLQSATRANVARFSVK